MKIPGTDGCYIATDKVLGWRQQFRIDFSVEHNRAALTHAMKTYLDGARRAGSFNAHRGPSAAGDRTNGGHNFARLTPMDHLISPQTARILESRLRNIGPDDVVAEELLQKYRPQADRSQSDDGDGITL